MDYNFCGVLGPAAAQECTNFPSLVTNVPLQLLRDIINGVCYQHCEKRLEQQKGRPNDLWAAEENLEEER